MANVVNTRDLILQATNPRIVQVTLDSNVIVPTAQVDGLPAIIDGTKVIYLRPTSQVFQVAKNGTVNPGSINLNAVLRNVSGAVTYTVTAGTATLTANQDGSETLTYANMSTDSVTIQASVTDSGKIYTDTVTLVKVREGSDSINVILSNESHTLAAASDGTVTSYTGAGTTVKVFIGSTDDTANWTVTKTDGTGVTSSVVSNAVSVTAMTAGTDTSYVDITVSRNGFSSITKRMSLAKSKAGATGTTGTNGTNGTNGANGVSGNQYALLNLYLWGTSAPTAPNGSSTYNWNSGLNSNYTGTDSWSLSVPNNPGTPNAKLYMASTPMTVAAGTTTSSVSYGSASIQTLAQNGANGSNGSNGTNGTNGSNGIQAAAPTVYQWAATIPVTPTGPATFTWATQAFGAAPTGWSLTPGNAPSPGYTLWAARVQVSDSAVNTTTSFNWSSASITAAGYAGANGANGSNGANGTNGAQGASYVTAYCASASTSTTTAPAQTTGKTSVPVQNAGGITGAWSSTVPALSSNQYLYQSDGIYDPTTDKVSWSIPYWSSLKVGSLSVVNQNTGTLVVTGTISDGAGNWSVDSSGNMVGKSITIKDASGNIILGSGVSLNSSYAAPGTLNSLVSVTAGGALSGAGGGQVTNLPVVDTRNANTAPSGYGVCHIKEFKLQTVIGLPGAVANTYCVLETLKGWTDSSGGNALQWAYISSGVVYKRSAANDSASWGAWVRDLDTATYTGDLNATAGATLGTNVNGQITEANSGTLIGTKAIASTQISDLRTTNYAEDASGTPTSGAKMASTGNAFKVASNSFQIGTLTLSDYWFRLVQGIDGSANSNRIIWRGNNDATTRGGAPNIACLSIIPLNGMMITDSYQSTFFDIAYHQYTLTPTSYSSNTDNLDALQQIHVQYFTGATSSTYFSEFYQACPSRTYDAASGIVRGSWHWGWRVSTGTPTDTSPGNLIMGNGTGPYGGCLRVRIANTYGWSEYQDFGRPATDQFGNPTPGQNLPLTTFPNAPKPAYTGGSGSAGGACPAPWVKVRLLNGKEVNASDLHNGARLAGVNDTTMQPLPQGGVVRDLATIWARRYRVKLADGSATEWSENHRFAVAERGWVQVQNLRGGDQILGLKESIIDSVLAVGEGQVVSFRVEGAGTYFAGGLLCHNTKAAF